MLAKKKEVVKETPVIVLDESDLVSELKSNVALTDEETKEFIKKITQNDQSSHMKSYVSNLDKERKYEKHINQLYDELSSFESKPLNKRIKETIQDRKDTIFRHTIQTFNDKIGNVEDVEHYEILVEILKPYTNNDVDTCKFVLNKFLKDVKKNSYYRKSKKMFIKAIVHFFSTVLGIK